LGSPAVLNSAATNALRQKIHDSDADIQFFSDPETALNALRFPLHGETGNRNVLRGSRYWNLDTSVLKTFLLPWSDAHKVVFRWDSFNTFNHNVFGLPNADISAPQFGQITGSASAPRVMQFALRYEF
jgi:hypothetical protein